MRFQKWVVTWQIKSCQHYLPHAHASCPCCCYCTCYCCCCCCPLGAEHAVMKWTQTMVNLQGFLRLQHRHLCSQRLRILTDQMTRGRWIWCMKINHIIIQYSSVVIKLVWFCFVTQIDHNFNHCIKNDHDKGNSLFFSMPEHKPTGQNSPHSPCQMTPIQYPLYSTMETSPLKKQGNVYLRNELITI